MAGWSNFGTFAKPCYSPFIHTSICTNALVMVLSSILIRRMLNSLFALEFARCLTPCTIATLVAEASL